MFRYVKLKNYKSLVDLEVSFIGKKDNVKKMILIYGENGIGKSNFADAFLTLCETFETFETKSLNDKFQKLIDANKDYKNQDDFLKKMIKNSLIDVRGIIEKCKTIGSSENMVLEFGLRISDKDGYYRIETDNTKIVSERLEFVLNKNRVKFFEINDQIIDINSGIFTDKKYLEEIIDLIEKFRGKHSLISILFNEEEEKAEGYVRNRMADNFWTVLNELHNTCIRVKLGRTGETFIFGRMRGIMNDLFVGAIPVNEEHELDKAEELINEFYTRLYSDIKEVYYKKETHDGVINYKLLFKKMVYGNVIDVNYDLESTGTQNLLSLIPYLLACVDGNTVIIDEIDSGIHDLLVTQIIENLNDSITGQVIITTHNTMLLESKIDKENIYIFNVNQRAEKELVPITVFEKRIHPNLNIQKRYLNGMYGGVPIAMNLDFDDLNDILK